MLSHHRPDTKNRSISYSAPKLSPPAYLPPPVAATPPPLLHFPNLPQAWLYPADTCWELEWDKSEFPQWAETETEAREHWLVWQWGFNLPVMSLREIFPEDSAGPHPVPWTGWLAGWLSKCHFSWRWLGRNERLIRKQWEASDTSYGLLVCVRWEGWQLIVVFTMELIGSEWDDNYLYLV